ncbi:MAG TPA: response regulator transcription factor [Terriglobia bacterium]|nr:response regulator transcription factor [Terriglobia bacterium]
MIRRRILLVEDEPGLRRTLTDLLAAEGYAVESSADGLAAQELAIREPFDLIVLDVMLPSRSGFDVCKHLRKNGVKTPILMLTARSELNNKVLGFKSGADDYLTKPFESAELQMRVQALLRRAPADARKKIKNADFGVVHVDFGKSRMTRNGKEVSISERECRLLQRLIESRGDVVSRDELLQEVWGYSAASMTRTVDVHIAWLRQKVEDDPSDPHYILTVHGQGYRFSG